MHTDGIGVERHHGAVDCHHLMLAHHAQHARRHFGRIGDHCIRQTARHQRAVHVVRAVGERLVEHTKPGLRGQAADRTPTVYIFLDAKGTLHSLEPITMASMTRGYPSDITARAPWLLNGAKTLSYAFNCAVHRECARRGVGDAILFTEDGYTMECPNSSIVARYGDTFVTPDPRIGILNGTSQREMFAWALEEGKKAEYRKLPIAELREADSLYMTHGGWSIPISAIDGRALAVDAAEIQAINDAIHSGRTHEDALKIGPTGDYE